MLSTVYNTLFSSNETLTNTTQPSSHTSNCVCKSTENLVQFLTNRVAALERRLLEVEDKTKYMTNLPELESETDDEDLPEVVTYSESEVEDEDLPELVLSDFEDEEYLPENCECDCEDCDEYECDAETCDCPWNVNV